MHTIFEGRNPQENEGHIYENMFKKSRKGVSVSPTSALPRVNSRGFITKAVGSDVVGVRVPVEQRLVNMKSKATDGAYVARESPQHDGRKFERRPEHTAPADVPSGRGRTKRNRNDGTRREEEAVGFLVWCLTNE